MTEGAEPMNVFAVRVYVHQFVFLANHAEIARQHMTTAHIDQTGIGITTAQYEAIGSMLNMGAQASRYLWPSPNTPGVTRERRAALAAWGVRRGEILRTLLRAEKEDFPSLNNKIVRNGYEHFDEQLDAAFHDGVTGIMDYNVHDDVTEFEGEKLRHVAPSEGTVSMREAVVNLQSLRNEITNVAERAVWWRAMADERALAFGDPVDLDEHRLPEDWESEDPNNRI